MSQIINYIRSLPEQTFEFIQAHFIEMGCKISDNGLSYMISIPNDIDLSEKPFLRHAVGSIFTKDTNNLLCFGFPKTSDVDSSHFPIEGTFYATEYIVGTLLRAYWDGKIWRLSTNGSMNAYESYWISEKSFGQLFDTCLGRIFNNSTTFNHSPLLDKLKTTCCYQFLISDPTVHLHQNIKPYIYHVGTFDLITNSYIQTHISNKIHSPKVHTFTSKEQLIQHLSDSKEVIGCILYTDAQTQTPRYKILKDCFLRMKELLGNTPNMYLRYLECKSEGTHLELLMKVPSIRYYSSWVEKCLHEIIITSYNLYTEKYIKRQSEMFINYFYRPLLHDIHTKYNELRMSYPENKSKAKINISIVNEIITKYHPKKLHFILNGLKYLNTMNVVDPTTISSSKTTPLPQLSNE